ncbi:hypothetical protein Dsin_022728 [Dipteronia sinensis]|uniref:Disease resistance N-terminal domain-containing protein n=1 Tax=Dipteronia sinensis TaxID=43782 RepID=A0AAE0E032_9ROSI|nr:hypothetical protein Dsin_022728 [Dipteronia sinensis]
MPELVLSALLPVLFKTLASPELLKEEAADNGAVKMWLDNLQDLGCDAEDILDEYTTEALRRKLKLEEHQASTSKVRKLIPAYPSKRTYVFIKPILLHQDVT